MGDFRGLGAVYRQIWGFGGIGALKAVLTVFDRLLWGVWITSIVPQGELAGIKLKLALFFDDGVNALQGYAILFGKDFVIVTCELIIDLAVTSGGFA